MSGRPSACCGKSKRQRCFPVSASIQRSSSARWDASAGRGRRAPKPNAAVMTARRARNPRRGVASEGVMRPILALSAAAARMSQSHPKFRVTLQAPESLCRSWGPYCTSKETGTMRTLSLQGVIGIVFGATCFALVPTSGVAQGCTPIRFTTPIDLGGEGQAYQRAHQWKLTLGYRRLHSNQFFVGTSQDPTKGPGGQPPEHEIHTVVGDVAYSPTDRLQLNVSLPFSTASITRAGWGPGNPALHQQRATGIGDLSVLGALWLLDPKSHQNGNVSVGLGFKAPTGSHTKSSWFYSATDSVAFPADQTIQPSDGGWGFTLQAQAFQQVREGIYLYGFGTYTANPKDQTEVTFTPTSPLHWSVPDVYQARLGAAV